MELLRREGRPGVVGQESIGRLKPPQMVKGSEGNKTNDRILGGGGKDDFGRFFLLKCYQNIGRKLS